MSGAPPRTKWQDQTWLRSQGRLTTWFWSCTVSETSCTKPGCIGKGRRQMLRREWLRRSRMNCGMAVDYEKLGELIDGYGGIAADDLHALPEVCDTRDEEIMLMRAENARLRQALAAEVELILVGLRGGIANDGDLPGATA